MDDVYAAEFVQGGFDVAYGVLPPVHIANSRPDGYAVCDGTDNAKDTDTDDG